MGLVDFSKFQPKPLKRLDLSAYSNSERKRVDFASFVPKETLDLLEQEKEWDKELARRNDPTLAIPMGGVPGGPLGGNIQEYDGLQDDVIKFYEQEGRADPEELVRVIAGEKSQLLREELQRRGDFKLDRLNPVSEVPDFYDPKGKAVPMHRRTVAAPALSPERYKELEPEIKRYEQEVWEKDDYGPSHAETRNIAKRIESTDDESEKQRLRDLRGELKKRGTYIEEDRLEINEDPKRDKAITEAARPIVKEFKDLIASSDSSMGMVSSYDITRGFDNQIAAEQDMTKKRAMLEARRQLKDAKYIDDDESSGLKATLSSLGAGSIMAAKGVNELARWGMKGLYALANDTTGLPPEIRDAIDLERIGRASDEEATMQALDEVSQFLGERMADIDSVREDAAPGITDRRNKIMAAGGFIDAIKKSIDDPMATLSIVGDSVPLMAAGAGLGRAIAGMAGTSTTSGLIGSQVAGESILAGSVNAASVREQLMQPDVQEQIKTFPEWQIALDAAGGDEKKAMRNIADMAAGTTGVSSAALTAFFGRMFSGVNAQLAGAEVRRGLLPYARTVAGETVQEMGQEGGDKFSENIGVNEAGFQRDPTEGVGSAMGMGAVMGGAMASGIGAPQILGGRSEEDARILSMAADRDRIEQNLVTPDRVQPVRAPESIENTITPQMVTELKALGASDVQIHLLSPQKAHEIIQARGSAEAKRDLLLERPRDVARAPSTGDPDLDAGNALAEDIIASVRGQETDLERQDREEKDRLRELLPVTPITSIDEQQQAAQVLDGAPQIGSLDDQTQAAAELDAAIAERHAAGTIEPVDQGLADERAIPDVAGSSQAVDARRTDGMGGYGQSSADQAFVPGQQGPEGPIQEEVTDDLRTPDSGAVEAPQTVDENLLKMADLLSQEGSTDPLPPGEFSEAASELIPSVESEIGWTERGGNLVRDPQTGAVTGRTTWVAKPSILGGLSEFWKGRPEPISEKAAALAIEKFRKGERLAPIERRFVNYAGKYAEQILEETQAYNETRRAEDREPKTFTAPDGTEIRYSKPASRGEFQIAEGNDDLSALARLASRPEAFQTASSKTKNLSDLVGELMPKASIAGVDSVETEGGRTARELTINLPRNNEGRVAKAKIIDDGESVWIDVSDATQGQGAGKVYNIAAQYAANNGRKFIQDPSGLSDDGAYRRVSQLLSQALKQGTTANIDPGDRLTNKDRLPVRRIRWSQDDTSNLRELTDAEVQNTFMQVPEVAGFAYDFAGKQFINDDGEPVSDADFNRIAERYRASGRGPVRRKGNSDGSFAPIGGTTLKRAVLLDTISREAGGDRWNGILDSISLQQSSGLDPQLKKLFYSKPAESASDQTKTPEFKRWFGGSVAIDGDGNPIVLYHHTDADIKKFKMNAANTKNYTDDRVVISSAASGVWTTSEPAPSANMYYTASYPVYVSLKNPKWYSSLEQHWADIEESGAKSGKQFREYLERKRHDGFVIESDSEFGGTPSYVVFDPAGIKSAIGNTGAFDPQNPDIRYSNQSHQPKGDARKAAEKAWGKRLIEKLVRNRILTFVSRADVRKMNEGKTDPRTIIDDRANAFVVDGRAYIINENVSDDAAPGITLHEVGVHYGLEAMVGPEVFKKILADMKSLQKTDDRVKEAYARVPKDTLEKYKDEEALGYLVEMDPKHGLIQRIVDAIVTFLKRIGFQNEGLLQESRADEIMRIVRNSLRNAGKSQKAGVVVYSDYDNAYSQPEIGDNFYSAMARSVEQAKGAPKTGTPKKWKEWLDGAQRRGEFKQSERDWIGVDAWLDGREQTTRKELADFVRANEVQVSDVVLGEDSARLPPLPDGWEINQDQDEWVVLDDDGEEVGRGDTEREAQLDAMDQDEIANDPEAVGKTKFGGYRTPGDGKNYRELLLTLPPQGSVVYTKDNVTAILDRAEASRPDLFWYFRTPDNVLQIPKSRYQSESDALNYVLREKQPEAPADKNYRSSHWDQPNVLAHVRFDERTDAEGNRVLFLQELQSDLHQQGRKEGYGEREETVPRRTTLSVRRVPEIDRYTNRAGQTFEWGVYEGQRLVSGAFPSELEALNESDRLDPSTEVRKVSGVPNAPLKGTDEWATLAFKRMARWGAENNFDRIAWATGEQNADVFDLSKQVEKIAVPTVDKDSRAVRVDPKGGTPFIMMVSNDGTVDGYGSASQFSGKKLDEVIGKDMAEKVMALTEPSQFSGEGLKVGGEGMKGFYDRILPSAVNKWAKPFGARTEMAEVSGTMQPTITITPKMREAALKGLPLFSKPDPNFSQSADYTFKESDYRSSVVSWAKENLDFTAPNGKPAWQNFVRWFGDSQVVDGGGRPLVLYHGTDGDFNTFRTQSRSVNSTTFGDVATERTGVFLSDNHEFARQYGNKVMMTYASIKSPAEITRNLILDFAESIDAFGADRELHIQAKNTRSWGILEGELGKRFATFVQNLGHDGVTFSEDLETDDGNIESNTFVVFRPDQIKSATENSGEFDSATPDIRYSMPPRPRLTELEAREEAAKQAKEEAARKRRAKEERNKQAREDMRKAESDLRAKASALESALGREVSIADKIKALNNLISEGSLTEQEIPGLKEQIKDLRDAARRAKESAVAGDRDAVDDYSDLREQETKTRRDLAAAKAKAKAAMDAVDASIKAAASAQAAAARTTTAGQQAQTAAQKAATAAQNLTQANNALAAAIAALNQTAAAAKATRKAASKARAWVRAKKRAIIMARKKAADKKATLAAGLGANPNLGPSFVASDYFQQGLMGSLRKLRMSIQDELLPVMLIQKDIEKGGRMIEEFADVYTRENFLQGRIGNTIEQDERNYIAPLKAYMRSSKSDYNMLDDYFEAMHAAERNADIAGKNAAMPDGGSGMTTQQAKDFLEGKTNGYRSGKKLTPDVKRKMERASGYIYRLLAESRDRMLSNGLILQSEYDDMKKYKFYVPLKNELDGQEIGFGGGTGQGIDARASALRAATGRGEGNRAGNILAHALGDTQRLIALGEKARVGRTLARLVLDNPNKDVWEVEPVVLQQKLNTAGEVYMGLQNLQNDPLVMVVKFEGRPYKIKFGNNPVGRRLAGALKKLNHLDAKWYSEFFGGINRFYSKMITSYSPTFLVVNLVRDLFFGMTGLGAEKGAKVMALATKYYLPSMAAVFRDARWNPQQNQLVAKYLKEFSASGAKTHFNEGKQAEDFQKEVERFQKGYLKLLREASPVQVVKKFVEENSFMKFVEDANDSVENALRLSAFIALRETGESIEKAAAYVKNLTVNFNRKGTASTFMNANYLFFNVAMQGAHRTIKLLTKPKVMKKVWATVLSLAGMQVYFAMALAGMEDDDGVSLADKIPNHVWERNLVIPAPGSRAGYVTFPMPYGFNVFSYSGGRIARETAGALKGDQFKPFDVAADIATTTMGAFSPVNVAANGWRQLVPTLPFQLVTQSVSNKGSFGQPIRDQWMNDKQARAYQGKASTPMLYHAAAQFISDAAGGTTKEKPALALLFDWAPEDLKFLTDNIGGGPLRFLSQIGSGVENVAIGAESNLGDWPFFSAFIPKTDRGHETQRVFYDKTLPVIVNDEEIIKEAAARGEDWQNAPVKPEMEDTFKVARKQDGTPAKRPKGWLGPKLEPVRGSLPDIKRKVEKEIKRLRDEMRAIRNDPDMSQAKKKLAIDELNKEIASEMAILITEQRTQRREARNRQ